MPAWTVRVVGSILDIDRDAWNACPAAACPFLSWDFLALLEECGAASPETGWTPAHAELIKDGRAAAYAPLYVLAGSAGSFVWDDGMEAPARSVGLRWFPKLAAVVPFTPAPIWRPLAVPGQDEGEALAAAAEAITGLARSGGFSGAHLLWGDASLAAALGASGAGDPGAPRRPGGRAAIVRGGRSNPERWLSWDRQVFRWDNAGYRSFDDFVETFSKNMRRNVARDKADVAAAGVEVRVVRGDEAGPSIWGLMADYYERTNDKFGPWAARFLPRRFFELAPGRIGRFARFSAAYLGGEAEPLALAMMLEGQGGLWGRYWGSAEDLPGLHFETCYYKPIEYAIGAGLDFFDPGMGSDHKARRGFRSYLATSYHRVFDPRLRRAYAEALAGASAAEAAAVLELNRELPFRRGAAAGGADSD